MDKAIHLGKFDTSPADPNAAKEWKLWHRNFKYFLTTISSLSPDKLEVLFLYIGTNAADVIEDCTTYDDAIKKLEAAYLKPPSEIHARHLLQTRAQRSEESIDAFLLVLNRLASDCAFKDVTAKIYREKSIRDSFIRGLRSSAIRARQLENSSLDLNGAIQQARALEQAQIRSESYFPRPEDPMPAAVVTTPMETAVDESEVPSAAATSKRPFNANGKKSSCFNLTAVALAIRMTIDNYALRRMLLAENAGNSAILQRYAEARGALSIGIPSLLPCFWPLFVSLVYRHLAFSMWI